MAHRERMRIHRLATAAIAAIMLSFVVVLDRPASAASLAAPAAEPSVNGQPVPVVDRPPGAEDVAAGRVMAATAPTWPVAGEKQAELSEVRDRAATVKVTLETLAPDAVARLGGVGLGVRVKRADAAKAKTKVRLTLDYSGFAAAFGGSFADRLRVYRLPACVVDKGCPLERQRVAAVNDQARHRMLVEAETGPGDEAPPVFMLASGSGGSFSGNFGATDLAPTGMWQTGLSSGSFLYSYPVPIPPSLAGNGPELSFAYNSSSVDGMTSASNAQSGWTGLGWQLSPGYIERRYKPCAEDATGPGKKSKQKEWGHLCWESPDENDGQADTTDPANSELFLSLNGKSTRIVRDRISGSWRTQDDFGWRVEHTSGGASGQPYWTVTTQNGEVHRFGYRRDSMWQVPFAGDDPGEPCNSQYANSGRPYPGMCQGPWRWNLDQSIDANENLTTLYWKREAGQYAWHTDEVCCGVPPTYEHTPIDYDRGGYLDYIEWGSNAKIATSRPTSKVVFNMVSRCSDTTTRDDPLANPYPIDTGTGNLTCRSYLPPFSFWDVPDDLMTCTRYDCPGSSPSFFIVRRLDSVVTYSYDPVAGVWDDVKKLQLRFKYIQSPENGSNGCCTPALWLDYIRPVGLAGAGEIRLPTVDFDAVELNGRVDYGSDFFMTKPRAILPRIATIHNGFGGRLEVGYGRANPCPDGGAGSSGYSSWYNGVQWDRNDQDCFRVYDFWFPFGGGPEVIWGVYHKYLVTKVVERDIVGGSPEVATSYEYLGRPAWAFPVNYLGTKLTVPSNDTGGTTLLETASWSEARGYETIRSLKGSGTDPAGYSVSSQTFHRGMFDDTYSNGTPKQVRVTDFDGGTWDDRRVLAGSPLQSRRATMTAYSADPAQRQYAEAESERNEYARVVTGDGPGVLDPTRVDQIRTRARAAVTGGGFRYTEARMSYDSYGQLATRVADGTCTSISYARSAALWMLSYPSTTEERAGDSCTSGTVIGRTTFVYDDGGALTDGNVTESRKWIDASRVSVTKQGFDSYGRVTSLTDPLGKVTTTSYSPSTGWPHLGITTTDPLNHSNVVWPSRWHGQVTKTRDANGNIAEIDYDQLGRAVTAWGPAEPRAGGTPTARMAYSVPYNGGIGQPTAALRTTTEKLLTGTGSGAKWQASHTYDDGWGRVRETQTASPAGGRVVVTSAYDPRGALMANSAPVHNGAAPGSGLLNAGLTSLPLWTKYAREGLERTQAAAQHSYGTEKRRVSAAYHGEDMVAVSPPTGASTEYWFDSQDRVVKTVEWIYWGVSYETQYEYDAAGNLTKVTDANGNVRTYTYDWLGQMVATTDPDSGPSTSAYDTVGRLVSTVDARGQKISYSHDDLGRRTAQWAGEPGTGVKLAEWVYDTVAKGQLSSAIRWVGGNAYRSDVTAYDASGRATATRVVVPATEGALAGTYAFTAAYNKSGQRIETGMPAIPAAGLAAEKVTASYTDQGLAYGLASEFGGSTTYVSQSAYSSTGKLLRRNYGAAGQIRRALTWDPATDLLTNLTTHTRADTASPVKVQDDDFYHDASNNVVRIADKTAIVDGQLGVQSECFNHDSSNRLIFAWTTTKPDCSDGWWYSPDNKGPDPYWRAFTYDPAGNMTSQDTGGYKGDYRYPAAGAARPNAVTSIVYPDRTDTYGYDAAGNLTSRTVAGQNMTLTWDELGRLSRTTAGGQATEHLYGADGERLIRREPGAITLYLGDMELRLAAGAVTAKRYYTSADGVVIAVRSSLGTLTWLLADSQRSEQIAVDSATNSVSRQRYLPFGGRRGDRDDITATDRGFLGKTEDPSGLVLLSARFYDPSIGKFISPDPALDLRNPQWINPYAYAGNNPVSRSDPSGLASCSNKSKCVPSPESRRKQELAKYQKQCWYQGKNCSKLPKAERVPPWKRQAPKAGTVREALLALADKLASTKFMKALHNSCTKTVPDVGGRCDKAAEELAKQLTRAKVEAFCGSYKSLCADPAPDYLTIGVSFGKFGLAGGISLTVTRTGAVYFAEESALNFGIDLKNFGFVVKVGTISDKKGNRAGDKDVHGFPGGAAIGASIYNPLNGYTYGAAFTSTHYSKEKGVAMPGIAVGKSFGYHLFDVGHIWRV